MVFDLARKSKIDILEHDNKVLRQALQEIANGEGYYGMQAKEYKDIAKAALLQTWIKTPTQKEIDDEN